MAKPYFARFLQPENGRYTLWAGPYYAVLLVRQGSCTAQWPGGQTVCGLESLFLMKPDSKAELASRGGRPLQLLYIGFLPSLLEQLSQPGLSLEKAFNVVDFTCAGVRVQGETTMLLKNLAASLCHQPQEQGLFGQPIYERGLLEMLVVLTLRACAMRERQEALVGKKRFLVDDVFMFIKQHLTEEISLERLSAEFYVSREHIAREFKRQTGQTVCGYILKERLTRCQQLLCEGFRLTDIDHQCGFTSYNSLARAFKREYGITPKAYYKLCQQRASVYPEL